MNFGWSDAAWLAPATLGAVGLLVSFIPNITRRRERIYFIVAYIVITVGGWYADREMKREDAQLKNLEDEKTRKQIEAGLTGGNSFTVFHVDVEAGLNTHGEAVLWLEAIKGPVFDFNYWISPAVANRNRFDPRYMETDRAKYIAPIVHKGARITDRTLKPGEYYIEFDGRNGHWVQHLKIYTDKGVIKQMYSVTKDGKIIYELADKE